MAFEGEIGWIGKNCPEHWQVELQTLPMRSNAGWFIGTRCPECAKEDSSPNSRETEYYGSKEDLIEAYLDGAVRWRDTKFRAPSAKLIHPEDLK